MTAHAMLDVQAVADRLGLSPKAVRALILRGELSASKLANRIRVDADDLDAFLAAARVTSPQRRRLTATPPPAPRAGSLLALARATPEPFPLAACPRLGCGAARTTRSDMSVERVVRNDGEVVWRVRWREGDRNRSKVLGRKRDADAFDAELRRRKRTGEIAALDAGREPLSEFAQTW